MSNRSDGIPFTRIGSFRRRTPANIGRQTATVRPRASVRDGWAPPSTSTLEDLRRGLRSSGSPASCEDHRHVARHVTMGVGEVRPGIVVAFKSRLDPEVQRIEFPESIPREGCEEAGTRDLLLVVDHVSSERRKPPGRNEEPASRFLVMPARPEGKSPRPIGRSAMFSSIAEVRPSPRRIVGGSP